MHRRKGGLQHRQPRRARELQLLDVPNRSQNRGHLQGIVRFQKLLAAEARIALDERDFRACIWARKWVVSWKRGVQLRSSTPAGRRGAWWSKRVMPSSSELAAPCRASSSKLMPLRDSTSTCTLKTSHHRASGRATASRARHSFKGSPPILGRWRRGRDVSPLERSTAEAAAPPACAHSGSARQETGLRWRRGGCVSSTPPC